MMDNEYGPQDKLTTGVCPRCYGMRVGIEEVEGGHRAACETCGYVYPVDWGKVAKGWPREMLTTEQVAALSGEPAQEQWDPAMASVPIGPCSHEASAGVWCNICRVYSDGIMGDGTEQGAG